MAHDGNDKRKAWLHREERIPTLADFLAGAERRKEFLDFWQKQGPGNAGNILFYFALKLLPAAGASAVGAMLGRWSIPKYRQRALGRARDNLVYMRPDASEDQIDSWVQEFTDSQGRQRAEYSVMRRLAKRLTFVGTDGLAERCAGRPVIFLGHHIGNLELVWLGLIQLGIPVTTNYDPPKRFAHSFITQRERKAGGLGLVPPGVAYVRPALRILEDKGNLLIYCDEGFGGVIRAPLFGTPPNQKSNFAVVSRMARKTGALLCPVYVTRAGGVNLTFHALEPFTLPPDGTLLEDVALLNAIVEPIIAAYPAQWYFIDNRFA